MVKFTGAFAFGLSVDSLLAGSKICHLLMIFANSLDLDQVQQNVRPDLNPSVWPSDVIPEKFLKQK